MSKKTAILLYTLAAIIALALVVIYRRYVLPEAINNKIDDITVSAGSSNAVLAYNAAYNRLLQNFTGNQSALLAALIVAQGKVESYNYTSALFRDDNNAYGFDYFKQSKYAARPSTLHFNGDKPYAHYNNIQDSAREVAAWLCTKAHLADFSAVTDVLSYAQALYKNDYFEGEPATAYATDMQYYFTTNIV